ELKLSNRFGGRPKPGTPIMILRNDSRNNLSNGDVGVVIADDFAVFPGEGEQERYFSLESLPEYEVVFAMTIHKSQGSGFEQVLLILPPERGEHQLLSRELLYTGISRAKQRVILWSTPSVIQQTLGRCVERHSGLQDRIRDCFSALGE
ncbi:MAG: ATP-dependent RecD-like DNA helicase, partial [Victivallaceae bacterium]